jgi:hypothetical protein
MDGPYKKQFQIDVLPSNKEFVTNPYVPQKCDVSELVCFSLTDGASECHPNKSLMLAYDAQGNLMRKKAKHIE